MPPCSASLFYNSISIIVENILRARKMLMAIKSKRTSFGKSILQLFFLRKLKPIWRMMHYNKGKIRI